MADPTAIARDYLESWNRRDFTHIRELLDEQYSYTGGDGKRQEGPDAGMAVAQMWAEAFPDGRIETVKISACGENLAVTEFIGRGSHKGELMGIAPTGRDITIPVCGVLEIRDDKIVAERQYLDLLHVMQQLGVVAPQQATA